MKLDKNPKSMVLIMMAVGLFGIGVILTIAFFNDTSLMGVGVTLAVVGGAGAILGCIHMNSREDTDDPSSAGTNVAPPRIPLPQEIRFQESFQEANKGSLYYEPCTASPQRDHSFSPNGVMFPSGLVDSAQRQFAGPPGGVIFNQRQALGPLSPFDQRSFPVPQMPNSPPYAPDGDHARQADYGVTRRVNVGQAERTPGRPGGGDSNGARAFWSPQ
jgi:hypothetical protein